MIEKYPSEILSTKSVECTLKEGLEIADKLFEEASQLKWGKVVGLAAPQIGINKRVFLALDQVYINPKIIALSGVTKICKEGCYSLQEKKFDYEVKRDFSVKLMWINRKGKIKIQYFTGFPAQVIQHEYDHLEGRLCNGK